MGILRRPATAVALFSLLFLAHASLFIGALMDDAYISFRYARNLVSGLGLVFNAGERVEGFTNLSWTLLSALSLAAGIDPDRSLPLFGALSGVLLVITVVRGAARLAAREGRESSGLLAGLIVATSSALAFYAVSGLEETFFSWLVCLGSLALVERRLNLFAVLTALAFFTRPEGALLGLLGAAVLGRQAWPLLRRGDFPPARWLLRPLLLMAVLVLPWLLFKVVYFGDLFPNTLRAKAPAPWLALEYTTLGSLPLLGFGALVAMAARHGELGRERRELCAAFLVFTGACVLVGPDWMPVYRLLAPSVALLALAVDGCATGFAPDARASRLRLALSALAVVGYLGAQGVRSRSLAANAASWPERDQKSLKLAEHLRLHEKSFATINIGLLGYAAPELRVLDLVGLVDRHIASLPGGHLRKSPDDPYLLAFAPDVYVLTSSQPITDARGQAQFVPDTQVEGDIFARPWFLREYRYAGSVQFYARHYYHLFARRR